MAKIFIEGKIFSEKFNLDKGFIGIKDGVISDIGEGNAPEKPMYKGLILPSFINAHTHLGDYEINVDPSKYSLKELVGPGGLKHKGLKNLSGNEKKEGIKKAMNEGFFDGVTHFCDFREGGIKGAKTLIEVNEEIEPKALIFGRPKRNNFSEIDKLLKYVDGLGISGVNDYSDQEINYLRKIIKKKDIFTGVHAGESVEGQKKSLNEKNNTEIYRAIDLDPDYLVHVTNPFNDDLELIKEKNIPVIICARSNYKTGVGLPPLKKLMRLNVPIAFGTDNAMINSTSVLDELRFITKKYFNDPEKINIENLKTIFKIATTDAGKITNINNKIKEGAEPNLVIFEKKEDGLRLILENKNKIKAIIKGGYIQNV